MQPPLTDSAELSRRLVRLLGINTWDVAAALTHLDGTLFKSIHEVYTHSHTHTHILTCMRYVHIWNTGIEAFKMQMFYKTCWIMSTESLHVAAAEQLSVRAEYF